MGSFRLPGKVLMKLNGKTVLECLIEQLKHSKLIDEIIIATTTNTKDDPIENFSNNNKLKIFRGSEIDVLDRFYQCSKKFSLKNIVRLTGDNPLIDPTVIDQVIQIYINDKLDYANNFNVRSFPHGCEVEIFSFDSLEISWQKACTPYEREHVTPFMYQNKHEFKTNFLKHSIDLSDYSWTVDTTDDFQKVRNIYKKFSKHPILMNDVISLLNENSMS